MDQVLVKQKLTTLDKLALFVFLISALLLWSTGLPGIFGINPNLLSFAILLMLFFVTISRFSFKIYEIKFLFFFFIFLFFYALITQSHININRYLMLPIALYLVWKHVGNRYFVELFSSFFTYFVLLAILSSWVSFFYVLNGGVESLTFLNPDGRQNALYLFSFSNAKIGDIIRPAFIYDEPGALSFVIVSAVIMREMLGKDRKLSIIILTGGLITLSFIHVLIIVIYLALTASAVQKFISIMVLMAATVMIMDDDRFKFFLDRFETDTTESDNAGFSNRTVQLENFFKVVEKNETIWFLGDYKCHTRSNSRCMEHGDISSSPVTPVYAGGIFFLTIQLVTHLLLLLSINKRFLFPVVALTLLLFQRPYFISNGYIFMIYIPLFYMLISNYSNFYTARKLKGSR